MQESTPSSEKSNKKSSLLRRALIGCVGLVAGCFVLSIAANTFLIMTNTEPSEVQIAAMTSTAKESSEGQVEDREEEGEEGQSAVIDEPLDTPTVVSPTATDPSPEPEASATNTQLPSEVVSVATEQVVETAVSQPSITNTQTPVPLPTHSPMPLPSATLVPAVLPSNTPLPLPSATQPPLPSATPIPTNPPPATATPAPPQDVDSSTWVEGKVTYIVDGDTFDVEIGGDIYTVRLVGIDTPERGQPLFQEASDKLASLVLNQWVRLEKDKSKTDRYGRLLRYVYLGERFINAEMVASGLARAKRYEPDTREAWYLEGIEAEAIAAGLGVHGLAPVVAENATPLPSNTQAATPPPVVQATAAPTSGGSQPPQRAGVSVRHDPASAIIISLIFYNGAMPQDIDEYIEVQNVTGGGVNLAGYRFNAEDEQNYTFGEFWLGAGESCRVYTGVTGEKACGRMYGSKQGIWRNSGGECGTLFDPSGKEVSKYCYENAPLW